MRYMIQLAIPLLIILLTAWAVGRAKQQQEEGGEGGGSVALIVALGTMAAGAVFFGVGVLLE